MVGIYKITNIINNKIYIDQSINIAERWYQHKSKAFNENELGYNSAIHYAFRKYGIENFVFEIIEECKTSELDFKERYWIQYYNSLSPNGYNILEGGQKIRALPNLCCDCGIEISRDGKRCKNCQAIHQRKVKDIPEPLELARLIKEKGFTGVGRIFGVTDNSVKKWCKNYNIPYLLKDLIKWYDDQLGIPLEEKKIKKTKIAVFQIDKNTNEILQKFESANAAARSLGATKGNHITEVCKGKNQTAYGYKWKYAEELYR